MNILMTTPGKVLFSACRESQVVGAKPVCKVQSVANLSMDHLVVQVGNFNLCHHIQIPD